MKKRICTLVLLVIFMIGLNSHTFAATNGIYVTPVLSFSGTTANCSVTIYESGKYINATLKLMYGSTEVDSWSKTGTTYVAISGTANVVHGRTYTLTVTGTIGGVAIDCTPVTLTCP